VKSAVATTGSSGAALPQGLLESVLLQLALVLRGEADQHANRLAEARDVLRDVLKTDPANAAALDLQKQVADR